MSIDLTPEQKKARLEFVLKIFIMLVIGFVVAPFIFIAVKGMLGIIAAGVVGLILVQFAPVVASFIANLRLKMLKDEAARNPIETLQNDYGRRKEYLNQNQDAIVAFGTEVGTFKDKLVGFKKQYPDEADKFDQELDTMQQLLKVRMDKFKQAKKNLDMYSKEIDKASAIWDMGQAAAKMNKASGMADNDFLSKIMKDTALDAVQHSMNQAFSELQVSLADESDDKPTSKTKSLPMTPKIQAIDADFAPLNVKALVKASS